MDAAIRDLVKIRANGRCEYCGIAQVHVAFAFQIEHIIARQHSGSDELSNLAFACERCNSYKGTNLSAVDLVSGNIVQLFHPRRDEWRLHFAMHGPVVIGLTDVGRATARLLRMNAPNRVALRAEIGTGTAPPEA